MNLLPADSERERERETRRCVAIGDAIRMICGIAEYIKDCKKGE